MYFNSLIAAQILAFTSVVLAAPAKAPIASQAECVISAITPFPKQLVCQTEGLLTNVKAVTTSIGGTQAECLAECKAADDCVSFGYAAATESCYIYNTSIKGQSLKNDATGIVFSNKNCKLFPGIIIYPKANE